MQVALWQHRPESDQISFIIPTIAKPGWLAHRNTREARGQCRRPILKQNYCMHHGATKFSVQF